MRRSGHLFQGLVFMTSTRRRLATGMVACVLLAATAMGAMAQSRQDATNLGTFHGLDGLAGARRFGPGVLHRR